MNFKTVIISLIFAVLFTCLSHYWFIKTDYWYSKYSIPELTHIGLIFDNDFSHSDGNYFIAQEKAPCEISSWNPKITKFPDFSFSNNKQTMTLKMPFSAKSETFKFKITPLLNSNINIKFYPFTMFYMTSHPIEYTSILINGKESLDEILKNDYNYNTYLNRHNNLDISITGKIISNNTTLFDNVNVTALIIVLIGYFTLFYYLFNTITRNRINFIKHVHIFIKKNINSIFIFIFFFGFYAFFNCNAAIHISFFDDYWVIVGDSNVQLANIIYSETKRFHPYAFLPFYPIFTFFTVVTQNVMLSIFLIYASITAITVTFLYNILSKLNPNSNIINILVTSIFGFSHCCILFTYSYEVYVFTAFYLSIIAYYLIKDILNKNKSYNRIILIAILAALSFGVTISNIITILILFIPFLFSKNTLKKFGIFILLFITFTASCIWLKGLVCNQESFRSTFHNPKSSIERWVLITKADRIYFKYRSLFDPIVFNSENTSISFLYCWSMLILIGFLLSFSKRVPLAERNMFLSFSGALTYNLIVNYYWAPALGQLYSPNYFILWFILAGYSIKFINIHLEKYNQSVNNRFIYLLLVIFVILLAVQNCNNNHKIQKRALEEHPLTINLLKSE